MILRDVLARAQAILARGEKKRSRTGEPRVLLWYASLARAKALASCRYRIGNLAEAGTNLSVVIAEDLPRGVLTRIDALVIVRPFPSASVRRALRACARLGVVRIADYDDLLFAGAPEERPEVLGARLSLGWMESAQRAYAEMLPAFDAFTVATEPLAEELRAARPTARVSVVPNGLSASWVAQGRALYPAWKPGDRRVVRFFPGSPTHDASFDAIRAPLAAWLEQHDDAALEVVGNLSWDASAFVRASHRAAVPYDHLPELLASAWVNLWPRADSRFNRVKSPIKFLEAAAFGCPTIASASCSPEIECDGLVRADGERAWLDALERFSGDGARARASEACVRYADDAGTAALGAEAFRRAIAEATS